MEKIKPIFQMDKRFKVIKNSIQLVNRPVTPPAVKDENVQRHKTLMTMKNSIGLINRPLTPPAVKDEIRHECEKWHIKGRKVQKNVLKSINEVFSPPDPKPRRKYERYQEAAF